MLGERCTKGCGDCTDGCGVGFTDGGGASGNKAGDMGGDPTYSRRDSEGVEILGVPSCTGVHIEYGECSHSSCTFGGGDGKNRGCGW